MENENETVADIARDFAHESKVHRQLKSGSMSMWQATKYSLRYQAAHKREMADFEATKRVLANVIAEKKQFAEIAAKKDRDIGSLKIDIAILSNTLFNFLSKAYRDEKYGRHQAMLAILNNGREGHFHKDEVIKMFRDEFCDCVVDHEACTVTRSEGSDR